MKANSPEFVGDVGAMVANIRESPLPDVLSLAVENAKRLYGP